MNKSIRYIFRKSRSPFKALKIIIKRQLGWLGVPKIVPYTAFGNHEKIYFTGAVIEDKGLARPEQGQKFWKNALAMVKRYAGDEIAGVRVRIAYEGVRDIVRTNEQGLFHTVLPSDHLDLTNNTSLKVQYTLLDEVVEGQDRIVVEDVIRFARKDSDFLVVSDIDDTILVSHSTRMLKKLRLMLFKNALTRSSFKGVAAFYRALCQPGSDRERSLFYISSSEWNLYDLLVDFLHFNGIPVGSLLLSNNKLKLFRIWRSGKRHQEKIQRLSELFEFYHQQHFILIGDSGQRDPEIYLKIVAMYPSRVKAIYIRNIKGKKRDRRMDELVLDAREMDTEMVPVLTTTEAARHALSRGYIDRDQIPEIESEKRIEEKLVD